MDRRPPDSKPKWVRFTGIGFEYVAAMAVFALVGYWIDRHYETWPWGVIIGAVLGLIGGTYNLVRESTAAFRQMDREARKERNECDRD